MKINFKTTASFVNANGETVNFEKYFEGASQFAERVHRRGVINEDDARDLFQDAALKILVCAPRHGGERNFPKSYGYRAAQCCHINQWHANKTSEPFSECILEDKDGDKFAKEEIVSWRCNENNPERELVSNEITAYIWECVDSLGDTDRDIVTAFIFGDKPKDIAERLGISADLVSVRLFRARKILKKKLGNLMREYKMSA